MIGFEIVIYFGILYSRLGVYLFMLQWKHYRITGRKDFSLYGADRLFHFWEVHWCSLHLYGGLLLLQSLRFHYP